MPPIDPSLSAVPFPELLSADSDPTDSTPQAEAALADFAPSLERLTCEIFGTQTGPPIAESLEYLARSLFEDRIVDWGDVIERTSLSKRTIQRLMQEGAFPLRVELSDARSGWRKFEIDRWIRSRPASPPSPIKVDDP